MIDVVIGKLISLLGPLKDMSKDRRELRDNALRSISQALNETCLYYRDIERGGQRNFEIEAQLSKYWAAAAIPMRHLDAELAIICEEKSDYWINPEQWSSDRVKEVGIALDDVKKRYKNLLYPRFSFYGKHRRNTNF